MIVNAKSGGSLNVMTAVLSLRPAESIVRGVCKFATHLLKMRDYSMTCIGDDYLHLFLSQFYHHLASLSHA